MRTAIIYIIGLFAAVAFNSCNNDAFTENLLQEPADYVVNCSDSVTVKFNCDDWRVFGVLKNVYLNGDVYDISGLLKSHSAMLEADGLFKMVYESDLLSFRIERYDYNKLNFILEENLYDENQKISIEVGNKDSRKNILLDCAPGVKYTLDSVIYDYGRCQIYDSKTEEKYSIVYDNSNSKNELKGGIYPYLNEKRTIIMQVDGIVPDLNRIMGSSIPALEVPVIENGMLLKKGIEIGLYLNKIQELPLPFPNDGQYEIRVNPGENKRFQLTLVYYEYDLPYVMYISNVESGRQRTYTGKIYYSCPHNYFITESNTEK